MFESMKRVAVFVAFAISVVAPAHANAVGRLEATLESPYSFDAQRSVVVRLTLRNNGDEAVIVYKWDTPFAPAGGRLPRSQFVVTDATGAEVRYRGRWVNMGPILADQFYTIRPGEQLSKEVDLTHEYDYGNGVHSPFRTRSISTGNPTLASSQRLIEVGSSETPRLTLIRIR